MQLLHAEEIKSSNEQILQLILREDELSWQQLIYDLVRREQMDPWDIDVSTLTQKFLHVIRTLQQMDFRIGGKLVLASAMLLKIKSDRLLDEDLAMLDTLINTVEEDEPIDLLDMDMGAFEEAGTVEERPRIYPRAPQPRQRKVSVYDLVTALEQALEVSVRRDRRALDAVELTEVKVPEKSIDVSEAMNGLLQRISSVAQDNPVSFFALVPGQSRRDTVLTFIPLLHLTNERRVDLEQEEHFGDISITLLDDTPVEYKEAEATA